MKTSAVSVAAMAMLLAVLLGVPNVVTAQGSGQDTLIVGVQNDTPNLRPWDIATNSVWKSFLWRQWVYEGFYGLSPDGSVYPVLAQSLNVVDQHNITVTIRTGVTFTDGQPLTVDDVIFSFQTLAFNSQLSDTILKSITWQDGVLFDRWNSTDAWAQTYKSHVGIVKVDSTTVRFQLRQDYSMFYFGTLTTPIMPAHIWKDHLVTLDTNKSGFSIPGGVKLEHGYEFDLDSFGAQPADVQATIGTGPWYLAQWTPLTSAELKIYDGYWGKSKTLTWQGKQWPFFPTTLRNMLFKIYGTLDVAILALKSGDVHMVPWDLPPGFYNDLKRDPRMGFGISAADGFFYIAFNMRKKPMDDLAFRRAVGYAIDKDFIVNRLLAGFGIKGEIPMSPINPAYINSSATTPPFDLGQARNVLDAAGYVDVNSDGWRDMPDGSALKLNILTPAKDYDPVRADAGIMISNNLKKVGLNVDSSPTAFDAIVSAVFVAVQFDMYILGWVSLGPFPELYLFDFFSCQSDVLSGQGDNTPGYCNPEFEQKLSILDQSMNDAVRIQAAKDAEGMLTNDLPYDTLYSKRWIEGYRQDIWGGWISVNGEIFNLFSIGVLGSPGGGAISGPLTISLDGPGQAVAGTTIHLQAYAVQNALPAQNVLVNVTATGGIHVSGTTDASGYADIAVTLPMPEIPTDLALAAVGTKGTDTGGDFIMTRVTPKDDIAQLVLSTDTPVIAPGATAVVNAKVTNSTGSPVSGVEINVVPELVLGTVSPSIVTTTSSGTAILNYTAPPLGLIPNRNHYDYLKATVTAPNKLILPETKTQTLVMGVQNNAYDWYVVTVDSVSDYVVDNLPGPIPLTSVVDVSVTKHDGTPVAGEDVKVTMSNTTALLVDAPTKPTTGAGTVSFTFTANSTVSTPVSISFDLDRAFYSVSGLTMLVANGTKGYAMSMTLTSRFVDPNTEVSFDIIVYNETGALAPDAEAVIFAPYNTVGNPLGIGSYGVGDLGFDVLRVDEKTWRNWTMYVFDAPAAMGLATSTMTIKDETGTPVLNAVSLTNLATPAAWSTYKVNYTKVWNNDTLVTSHDDVWPTIYVDRTTYPSGYTYEVSNGSTLVASGYFGYWSFIGSIGTVYSNTTFADGHVTGTFTTKSFPADNLVTLEVGIGSFGPQGVQAMKGYPISFSPAPSYFYGSTIQKRNKITTITGWTISQPAFTPTSSSATLSLVFKDASGVVPNLSVRVYRGTGDLRTGRGSTRIGTYTTGTNGNISVSWTEPGHLISVGTGFTAVTMSSTYALGGQVGSIPFEQYFGYVRAPDALIPTGSPSSNIVRLGNAQTYSITVKDFSGAPIQGAAVKPRVAGNSSGVTDGTGHISIALVPGSTNPTGTDVNEMIFDITYGSNETTIQLGTLVGIGIFSYTNLQSSGGATVGKAMTISVVARNDGPVQDTAVVVLNMEGNIYAAKSQTIAAGGSATVEFTYTPSDTGEHTFTVGTATPLKITASGAGMDAVVVAGVGIALLIVGILVGYLVGKRKKPEAPVEMLPEEKAPEAAEEKIKEETPPQTGNP